MGRQLIEGEQFLRERLEELRARAEKYFPGAKYVSVYSHTRREMVQIPIEFAIASQFGHAPDYGSGVFEGGSAVMNEITGEPSLILDAQRVWRLFHRSLPARGYHSPISEAELSAATLDLIAANGPDLFRHPKTSGFCRAYIRPTMQPASLAGFGISLRPDYPIDVGIAAWAWPDSLPPELVQKGGVVAVTGHQRLFPITGKHASNYGAAVKESSLARTLGASELIYLAPYLIDRNDHLYWADPNNLELKLVDGVLADGPGEEIIALSADQKTITYPPMRVNRLGGTVLFYIVEFMAKNLGLDTREADITLHDLRAGKYAGLAMVGNAVKVTPMRQLNLYRDNELHETIELFAAGHVPEMLEQLRARWEGETRGLIAPSHSSLLTPVSFTTP